MKVLFFGISKDIVGQRELSNFVVHNTDTVESILERLKADYPELSKISSLAISVNQKYADITTVVKNGDIIALIPPVSGG